MRYGRAYLGCWRTGRSLPAQRQKEIAVPRFRFTLALAVLVGIFAHPAPAEPLSAQAGGLIEGTLFRAKLMSNPKAALQYCREAEAAAARYDPDPFYNGAVARCVAYAQKHLNNREAACKERGRALEQLQSVRSTHSKYSEAIEQIAAIRGDQTWFGC
jgi:hypothetical protein